jgi:hypothetical protein
MRIRGAGRAGSATQITTGAGGRKTRFLQARVWLAIAPLAALYVVGFLFIINEEIFTGTMAITLRSPAD